MSRHDTGDSALRVLRRPPAQRKLTTQVGSPDLALTEVGPVDVTAVGVTATTDTATVAPSADVTATDVPTIDVTTADVTTADVTTADVTTADVTTADVLTADVLTADVLTADVLTADVLAADVDPESSAPRVDPRLITLASMTSADPRHGSLRRVVVEAHLPLVHHLAQRFRGRGEPYDDLVQVGTIGLLHAVDRYDPSRGSFTGFAVPTIIGEIRRHFRDRGWALRIPRRVQDLGRRVSQARETLTHNLDRSPTVHELAVYLEVDPDLVLEALETASAYLTVPLPITADESDRMTRACEDSGLELVEQRETLRPLLAQLPARQQRILELRFFRGMSQSQIAHEIGVSQMHVSRLLAKSLAALRSGLTQEL